MPHRIKTIVNATHPQNADVAADVATGVSIAGFGGSMLVTANQLIQLGAGVVAMVAGITAAWWHIERIREVRRMRRESENENILEDLKEAERIVERDGDDDSR